jgi:serine/threonine protein kinase
MLTGDLPFIADNPIDLFDSIRDDPVPIPAEWPEPQKDIIRRMLVKDAASRITIDEIRVRASRALPELAVVFADADVRDGAGPPLPRGHRHAE